ncbi:interferon-stimulated 20 kDa exonuclease-like 2 [Spea bombifrons]|uniref:interferon-stimulated 20 kDa exonuclease-like 2 n=1 Tax=Spea bombifrons TaxID=233779 RepID=UPI00234A2107|nr:interferon-stimulated 20 kDa exonuclease-like 2 [Spea bombifrons]
MSNIVLNLDSGPCPSGGKKEHFNTKHQQFLRKRKFLERKGFLKQKQLPAKPNAGHASNSWGQTKERGGQDGSWTKFNRTKKPSNQTGLGSGFHQQDVPDKSTRNAFRGQGSTLTVRVDTGPHHSRVASYVPNTATAVPNTSSAPSLVNGRRYGANTHCGAPPEQRKVNILSEFESGLPPVYSGTKPSYKLVAIDCEMVGTGPKGRNSDLARCSVVSYHGDVVYDKYIKPESPVTDYRSKWSGIRREHMVNATPFSVAQKEILKILSGKIVVGHAIHNDFKALRYFHPKEMTRDTSMIPLLNRKAGFQDKESVSLKRLAKQLLRKDIQTGRNGHSSVEDAKTTMELYRVIEAEWERELAAGNAQK